MTIRYRTILIIIAITLAANFQATATDFVAEEAQQKTSRSILSGSIHSSETELPISWPTLQGVHQNGKLAASFNSFGQFGLKYGSPTSSVPGWPQVGFVVPATNGPEYLYGGGIWVGGILGEDTLVSTGINGVSVGNELNPPGYRSGHHLGTVTTYPTNSGFAMRAEFTDTLHTAVSYGNDFFGRPHQPLNLKIANRSYSFTDEAFDDFILYDIVLTNIGDSMIHDAYVGLFFDADIGYTNSMQVHLDDLTGSIRDIGAAYMVDNDGDLIRLELGDSVSVTRIFGAAILESSFPMLDTSYNWWANNTIGLGSFGPRGREDFRDFENGHLGLPLGDINRYHLMSSGEWDYDQVMTASIGQGNPNWLEPPSQAASNIADGADSRFLLSVGPVDLLPDSSARLFYTISTADSIITRTDLIQFINTVPELYDDILNLDILEKNIESARSLIDNLKDPKSPVIGQQVRFCDHDSVVLEWDPWVYDNVDGYEIYLWEVPASELPYPGILPPWMQPTSMNHFASVDRTYEYSIYALELNSFYLVNIAHRSGSLIGDPGPAVGIVLEDKPASPVVASKYLFAAETEPATIRWSASTSMEIDHYNVYRFPDSAKAARAYHKFYDRGQKKVSLFPVDSFLIDAIRYFYYAMEPLATTPSGQLTFTDSTWEKGASYLISAVNSHGFESEFSDLIILEPIEPRRHDILVLTFSTLESTNNIPLDSITAYYNDILSGYDYDLYIHHDSIVQRDCVADKYHCLDWHNLMPYKLVIVDDGVSELILTDFYENHIAGFQRYLLSGGKLAYFGSLEGIKHYGMSAEPKFYHQTHPFIREFLGIDSMFYIGAGYYSLISSYPFVDSLTGFSWAEPAGPDIPELHYRFDTTGSPLVGDLLGLWPKETPPPVAAYVPKENVTVTHRYRSIYQESSLVEGRPVGLSVRSETHQAFVYGFHLWYMDRDGGHALVDWMLNKVPTEVDDESKLALPHKLTLHQNYPNPFNPATLISFELPARSDVRLEIFNILGQSVATLIKNSLAAGQHQIIWNGTDNDGNQIASGLYFYRLKTDNETLTKKMLLLK